jgi:hypothetical protein
MRQRRKRVRDSLPEIGLIGLTKVTEYAPSKYNIARPKATA